MTTYAELTLAVALSGVWLTAGLLADGLAAARTARELRRRAGVLSTLVGAGLIAPALSLVIPHGAAPAVALPTAVPALVVLVVTVRRLGYVRRGAGTIETTALTPVPPALRGAAAHPLIVVPAQVTGLASLLGLPIAAGLVTVPGASMAGFAITGLALAATVVVVRAAVRHSRLTSRRSEPAATEDDELVSSRG